jgi:hypothetical protein
VRQAIFELLERGPLRQFEFTRIVSERLGKKYSIADLRYHLELLERAGLIGYSVSSKKVKIFYRAADVQVRLRRRPEPSTTQIEQSIKLRKFAKALGYTGEGGCAEQL